MKWTKPYYGVSHLGELCDRYRISVCEYESFTLLHKWFPGCGFSPIESQHDTVLDAMQNGEKWLKEQS